MCTAHVYSRPRETHHIHTHFLVCRNDATLTLNFFLRYQSTSRGEGLNVTRLFPFLSSDHLCSDVPFPSASHLLFVCQQRHLAGRKAVCVNFSVNTVGVLCSLLRRDVEGKLWGDRACRMLLVLYGMLQGRLWWHPSELLMRDCDDTFLDCEG